jgi:hypothetical protein
MPSKGGKASGRSKRGEAYVVYFYKKHARSSVLGAHVNLSLTPDSHCRAGDEEYDEEE